MAQVALGVVGGVVGFMLGGPAGAAIGFGIGMALTPEMPGATIGEIAKQTAKEGDPRLIVWGIVRPVGPNIIASEDPPRRYQVSQGGKGSGPTSEAIYRTYALGVCEGPITGYRRIWRNNKLVYDGRNGSVWGAYNNPVFLQKATFYYGSYTQLPDPNLEAVFGAGEVPAHRGTAYVVIADEDLTDTGGAVPQWIFEVERGYGTAITSKPYPIIVSESVRSEGGYVDPVPEFATEEEIESLGGSVLSGEFRAPLIEYEDGLPEEIESEGGAVISGEFRQTLITYDDGLPEEVESLGGDVISGVFKVSLIEYNEGLPEEIESTGGQVISGVHN